MFTLNIYEKTGNYICSITKKTRKECLVRAEQQYSEKAWDWDDKNYVRGKRYDSFDFHYAESLDFHFADKDA